MLIDAVCGNKFILVRFCGAFARAWAGCIAPPNEHNRAKRRERANTGCTALHKHTYISKIYHLYRQNERIDFILSSVFYYGFSFHRVYILVFHHVVKNLYKPLLCKVGRCIERIR